jgi:two-component system chemotaxis response regulator CheB
MIGLNKKKIRVLIVDDSLLFREVLAKGLSEDPQIEIVGKAGDPFQARDMIVNLNPDVMTCDIEMPKMNGIEFIRRLLPQHPMPVIVVSSISNAVFDAMSAGAVDFVTKPDDRTPNNVKYLINELAIKIKTAPLAKIRQNQLKSIASAPKSGGKFDPKKIIFIGASTGGTEAIYSVLKDMPLNIPGIVIVQHIPPVFSRMFAERMNMQTPLTVVESAGNEMIEPGKVFIAPGDKHLRIKKVGGTFKTELYESEKVNGHCPSVDVLFFSAAKECGKNAVGVILTGMGQDGAKGLLEMKKNGAYTIGQDEKTSIVYGMPKVAFELGAVDKQCGLDSVAVNIIEAITLK